jgi:CelD/BcsL family acetyltransferase involved in cellulose biosynthesis
MLDMMVLKLDGRPAAFQYNYHYQGNLFGLRMGFDRDFVKQGVGRALMGWLLQDSCARGDRLLDLGLGDYEFKRRFRTEVQASYSYAYYPPQAWRGQSLRLTRWVKSHWKTEKGLATKC